MPEARPPAPLPVCCLTSGPRSSTPGEPSPAPAARRPAASGPSPGLGVAGAAGAAPRGDSPPRSPSLRSRPSEFPLRLLGGGRASLRERRRRREEYLGAPPGRRGAGRPCSRALAASKAIGSAQSPHAGCSGGLRGLARGRASTGARASGCVLPRPHRSPPPGPHRSPPSRGAVLPAHNDHPSAVPAMLMLHLGPLPARVADAPVQRKGAKGALPARAHAPTAALGRTLQQFALSRRTPPRLHSFAYPTIVANQDSSISKRTGLA